MKTITSGVWFKTSSAIYKNFVFAQVNTKDLMLFCVSDDTTIGMCMNRWTEDLYTPSDITKITREEFIEFIGIAELKVPDDEMVRLFGKPEMNIEELNNRYPEYIFAGDPFISDCVYMTKK